MKITLTLVFLVFYSIRTYSQNNNPLVSSVQSGAFSNNNISYVVGKIYVLPPTIIQKKVNEKDDLISNIKAYPNPVTNILTVETLDKSFVKFIEIYDMTGKILYSNTLESNTIDFSFFKQGAYTIKLDKDYTKTFKIIKN